MLHPNTRLVWISDKVGYGIIATQFIPAGTITFVQDSLDIIIRDNDPLLNSPLHLNLIERYSYINAAGDRIISWDFGKYMNHCCHANTLTTGYGFEMAIRDIQEGEEVTDDYGIFTEIHEMDIDCQNSQCRMRLNIDDFDSQVLVWDHKIKNALPFVFQVDQPLMGYLDEATLCEIKSFLVDQNRYISVSKQKPSIDKRPYKRAKLTSIQKL